MNAATRRAAATRTMTVGRILPKFVTPTDVRDLKNRVDPFVLAVDQGAADCAAIPEGARTGWNAFSKAWRSFFTEEDSWWHVAAQMDQGEAYEKDLAHWQDWLAQYKCAGAAPRITPSTESDDKSTARTERTIKTVAIAGAVIAVALVVRGAIK
jgi:hypothetical protein